MSDLPVASVVSLLGFAGGLVFGATSQRTNFCTMGAISDMVNLDDYRRFRAWLLAIAVATAGSEALDLTGAVDLGRSIYLTPALGWLGAVVGGLLFGFGMTLAGGCGVRTLVRLGAGNLKSLVVVLVLGVFAYMTLRGLLAVPRTAFIEPTNLDLTRSGLATQGIPEMLSAVTGLPPRALRGGLTAVVVLALLAYCFKDAAFRRSPADIVAGIVIGLLVPAGWIVTGVVGNDPFEPTPLASYTFVAPIGDSLMYLMAFTGATINFGIAGVGGVILGAFAAAIASRSFRIESFTNADDLLRHVSGAATMGTGGVLALGCTIGQGITGVSTLAAGSVLALLSIIAGGVYGIKYLEEGTLAGALRAMLARG